MLALKVKRGHESRNVGRLKKLEQANKKTDSPQGFQNECSPAKTLILAQ